MHCSLRNNICCSWGGATHVFCVLRKQFLRGSSSLSTRALGYHQVSCVILGACSVVGVSFFTDYFGFTMAAESADMSNHLLAVVACVHVCLFLVSEVVMVAFQT